MSTEPEKSPQPYGDSNDYGYENDLQDGIQDGPVDDKPQPWTGPPPPPPPRET